MTMGGHGSGNFRRRRTFVEECIAIRLPELRRLGLIQADHIRSRHVAIAHPSGGSIPAWVQVDANLEGASWLTVRLYEGEGSTDHRVRLEAVPQPLGGHRWFALCPLTGRRCLSLFLRPGGPHLASRSALDLTYLVNTLDAYDRAHKRASKAEVALRGLSRFARRPTRERLWSAIWDRDEMLDDLVERVQEALITPKKLKLGSILSERQELRLLLQEL
ncbi:MAG: hypothetical protein INE97_02775 [Phenylobacterium sp.]|nr:hypothetical protein [Phenylobacterium sp.]